MGGTNSGKTISDSLRICFTVSKKKQTELAARWGTSRQAISNKFYRDYWSADELADLAEFFGAQLMFKFPDGLVVPLVTDSVARKSHEEAEK